MELNDERKDDTKVPIWQKANLTIKEASEYSNIGIHKIRELIDLPGCDFVLNIGAKKLIKREMFEKFMKKSIDL